MSVRDTDMRVAAETRRLHADWSREPHAAAVDQALVHAAAELFRHGAGTTEERLAAAERVLHGRVTAALLTHRRRLDGGA